MSMATTFSMSGSFSLGMVSSAAGGLILASGKLIILYNKFRKTAKTGGRHGRDAGLRDRFLEGRQFAESLGRDRARRAAQDHPLHADQGGDRALLPRGRRNPSGLFRRGLRQNHPLWRADRAALDPYPLDVLLHAGG